MNQPPQQHLAQPLGQQGQPGHLQQQQPISPQQSLAALEATLVRAIDLCHSNTTTLETWNMADQHQLWSNIDAYIATLGQLYDTAAQLPSTFTTSRQTLLAIDSGVNPLSVIRSQVDSTQNRQDVVRGEMAQAEIFRETYDNLLSQWTEPNAPFKQFYISKDSIEKYLWSKLEGSLKARVKYLIKNWRNTKLKMVIRRKKARQVMRKNRMLLKKRQMIQKQQHFSRIAKQKQFDEQRQAQLDRQQQVYEQKLQQQQVQQQKRLLLQQQQLLHQQQQQLLLQQQQQEQLARNPQHFQPFQLQQQQQQQSPQLSSVLPQQQQQQQIAPQQPQQPQQSQESGQPLSQLQTTTTNTTTNNNLATIQLLEQQYLATQKQFVQVQQGLQELKVKIQSASQDPTLQLTLPQMQEQYQKYLPIAQQLQQKMLLIQHQHATAKQQVLQSQQTRPQDSQPPNE